MKIETATISWNSEASGSRSLPPLVLLHGFAQSLHGIDELTALLDREFRIVRLDLPGHGETLCKEETLKWKTLTSELIEAIAHLDSRPAHWFGYSQGGRVALMTALENSHSVKSLSLLGASPGIPDANERRRRKDSDTLLAQNIRQRGIDWFVSYWEALPIFSSQYALPEEQQQKIRRERLKCDPKGLAFALENYGTGTQPDCLNMLREWKKPLMLLAGQHDAKFAASNRRIAEGAKAMPLAHSLIAGAGHAAHIERPAAVARLIQEFCKSVKE